MDLRWWGLADVLSQAQQWRMQGLGGMGTDDCWWCGLKHVLHACIQMWGPAPSPLAPPVFTRLTKPDLAAVSMTYCIIVAWGP